MQILENDNQWKNQNSYVAEGSLHLLEPKHAE